MSQPPVVRATLLILIVCGGMLLGRKRIGLNSLALAGLMVLIVNPADLFHTGVQLSFLSVAVLIWAGQRFFATPQVDPLDRLIAASRPWPQRAVRRLTHGAAEVFRLGAIMWIFITPLTMARFHLFAPAALVLNVLLTPARNFGHAFRNWRAGFRRVAAASGHDFWKRVQRESQLFGIHRQIGRASARRKILGGRAE